MAGGELIRPGILNPPGLFQTVTSVWPPVSSPVNARQALMWTMTQLRTVIAPQLMIDGDNFHLLTGMWRGGLEQTADCSWSFLGFRGIKTVNVREGFLLWRFFSSSFFNVSVN